ncbi:isocitrate/isopropylmalate dehydrogenase family protein [Micromonospora tarensis]|uniref:Isocitrate/isopropylmalate dehydrogenase family protein n=1 Tax=Micromonospora tarensis TaxID=2806100 RepID=A0ABS1YAP5_9ACTN|nr:isocitrate/isopropylmalate family dehydrogenase [Micromonospora tarensis]MBM0274440.1 isocitrate/isopropylmalate dehydrogenase family protein [Micromonospora tarensis]
MSVITVIPGDGIGPEVIEQALVVMDGLGTGLEFDVLDHVNASTFLRTGVALSDVDFRRVSASQGTLLGAVGDPRVTSSEYARGVLLRLRSDLDLYVNHRPARLLDARLSPLRDEQRRNIDCVIVRENTEGLYAGIGGILRSGSTEAVAIDAEVNTYYGIDRVLEYAFSIARRGVCLVDKSNAVRSGGSLWQRCWAEAKQRNPDVPVTHLYVDAAAMKLVSDPASFDVIVTNNSYGDILSDLAAEVAGGIGAAASANINPHTGYGLYEPVHGSAPDIAGTGVANPLGAILSGAMLLARIGREEQARALTRAVEATVTAGRCTPDLGGDLHTKEVGAAVLAELG